jgi:hypothetical protein
VARTPLLAELREENKRLRQQLPWAAAKPPLPHSQSWPSLKEAATAVDPRPQALEPLPLTEREQVMVTVSLSAEDDCLDAKFMDDCAAESNPTVDGAL